LPCALQWIKFTGGRHSQNAGLNLAGYRIILGPPYFGNVGPSLGLYLRLTTLTLKPQKLFFVLCWENSWHSDLLSDQTLSKFPNLCNLLLQCSCLFLSQVFSKCPIILTRVCYPVYSALSWSFELNWHLHCHFSLVLGEEIRWAYHTINWWQAIFSWRM
jgi:hypothetical protein